MLAILKNPHGDNRLVVEYEYCIINGRSGCRLKNFLDKGEVFVTAANVYRSVYGRNDLADRLLMLGDATGSIDRE